MLKEEGQRKLMTEFRVYRLTLMMFPAAFSVSVWSSCSDESVSSRVCSSSSEGRRVLRYGMEPGCAAITGDKHRCSCVSTVCTCKRHISADFWISVTHVGRWRHRLWKGSEFLPSWPWSVWALAPRLSSDSLPSPSKPGSLTQVLWMSDKKIQDKAHVVTFSNDQSWLRRIVILGFVFFRNRKRSSDSQVFWCMCEGQGTLGSGWGCRLEVSASVQLTVLWGSQGDSSPELKLIKSKRVNFTRSPCSVIMLESV